MNKQNWKTDVAVLCIFFARPKCFQQVFDAVKKARPRKLLLWQDGPRDGREDDVANINKCREIAEDIDWDCEVYKNYHDKNMGCDPSTHLSHKWAFSIVDKCIILEDDIVPSQSFFPFCKELLDKYENDTRIDRICGQTLFGGVSDKRYSYFFCRSGSSWGWATWKRVADTWESDYRFLNDEYYLNLGEHRFNHKRYKYSVKSARMHAAENIPYWESIVGFRTTLQSGLVIYPTENMIKNVGASQNATHAPENIEELPKDIRSIFINDISEIKFPLKHPPYVIEDYHYFDKVMKCIHPSGWRKLVRKFEHALYKMKIIFRNKRK